ncbi:sensor histidine kinase [Luteimonas mephitis]|uniref:sensor histidine kinase n=1 Tax=Luteimonas mephitis TaxID=83615 RepID=UPI00068716E8|nr:sensor histidine kinase [Luteimonas mephitis]
MLPSLPKWLRPAPDSAVAIDLRIGKSPWVEAVHLVWSVWVFITPTFVPGGYSLRWALLTLVSYPLFILLYALCLLLPRRIASRPAYGLIALCLVLLPWYPSGISYFIFGCVMLRMHFPQSVFVYLGQLLLANAAFLGAALWIGYPWQSIAWTPIMTLVIGLVVNVERATKEKDAEIRLSHDEVRRLAATAERERIGRDLHDLLGHTLSLITLKLELSRKLFDRDPAAARRELEDAEAVARHALAEVRSAVTGIRATDLAAELASARLMLESSGVHLDYDLPPPGLAEDTERGLALVLREAATNITRHARAGAARIGFTRDGQHLQVLVADDGVGGVDRDGNGLGGMRERVARLGGTLSIESPRGQGTRLHLRLPLAAPNATAAAPDPAAATCGARLAEFAAVAGEAAP